MNPRYDITLYRSYLRAESIQVLKDIIDGITPKLSNGEQVGLSTFLANVLDKSDNEILVDVFDGIKAESSSAMTKGRKDPRSPVEEVVFNFWVSLVDIGAHWTN